MPLRTIFRLRLRSWSVSLKARAHYSSPSSIDRWLGFTRYTTRDATQFRDAIYLILSLSILSPPTQRHDLAPLTTTQRHDLAPLTMPQSAPPLYYYHTTVVVQKVGKSGLVLRGLPEPRLHRSTFDRLRPIASRPPKIPKIQYEIGPIFDLTRTSPPPSHGFRQ